MIYSSVRVDMDYFSEIKQRHKDEEEVQGYIDGPSQDTQRQKCERAMLSSFFLKLFHFFSSTLRASGLQCFWAELQLCESVLESYTHREAPWFPVPLQALQA